MIVRSLVSLCLVILPHGVLAGAITAAPQLSSQCEAYLKSLQSLASPTNSVFDRGSDFPDDALTGFVSTATPKPRQLKLKRDPPPHEQPFWRKKPGLLEKMKTERRVLTSVTRSSAPNDEVKFDMKVAGIVSAPRGFSFKTAQAYPRLKEVSDHFKTVHYAPQNNRLYLVMTALGYQERMIMEVFPVSGDGRDEIQFDVVWGNFKGMKGFIGFEASDLAKTEMSLISSYQSKKLPLPKILMGLALEAITQKVAEKLRSFIEADYKLAQRCGAS